MNKTLLALFATTYLCLNGMVYLGASPAHAQETDNDIVLEQTEEAAERNEEIIEQRADERQSNRNIDEVFDGIFEENDTDNDDVTPERARDMAREQLDEQENSSENNDAETNQEERDIEDAGTRKSAGKKYVSDGSESKTIGGDNPDEDITGDQSEDDKKDEEDDKDDGPGLLSNSSFKIALTRTPNLTPNQTTLQISQPMSISGCAKIKLKEPEVKFAGKGLWVTVKQPIIKLDKSPRYGITNCANPVGSAKSEIILDKNELQDKGIKELRLRNDFGSETYMVNITQNKMELIPKADTTLFTPERLRMPGSNPLIYWFYPNNTLLLTISLAKDPKALSNDIYTLMTNNGLVPMQKHLRGFDQHKAEHGIFYAFDPTGRLSAQIAAEKYINLGTIHEYDVITGAQGQETRKKNIPVLAKSLSLTD